MRPVGGGPLFSYLDSDDFFGDADKEGGGLGVNEYGRGGNKLEGVVDTGVVGVNRWA